MGEVTDLAAFRERRPDYVFQCPCGGQHFYLQHDGEIECRDCKQIISKIEWIYREPRHEA